MRILVLATTLPVTAGDGTPSFVLDAATALGPEHHVTIVAPRFGAAPAQSRAGTVTVRRFGYLPVRWQRLGRAAIVPELHRNPLRWAEAAALSVGMVIAAVRAHRSVRPDVVHAHWILPAGLVALLLNLLFGTPFLVTSHGADAYTLTWRPLTAIKQQILRRAHRFIAVSSDILRQFTDVTDNGVVQPVGVDVEKWERLVGVRAPETDLVVFVGRLAGKKGVSVAIDAVAALPHARLLIIGDGPERAALESRVARLGASDRIRFDGRQPHERIAAAFRTAACIVIPSVVAEDGDMDGTPSVLGEAIASRLPVVTSDFAGIRDYVVDGHSARLVPPGDVDALRREIDATLADPEGATAMAEAARGALEVLALDRTTAQHRNWYAEAATRA